MLIWFARLLETITNWSAPKRKVFTYIGDTLPSEMPKRDLILLRDDGENWSVGFSCPCGCEDVIELLLLPNVKPRWDITVDRRDYPTLHPSVWRTTGCRSHFWIRAGKVIWVKDI